MLRIERYGHTRNWAVYDGQDLVVVTVYRKGAQEVLRRLQALVPAPPPPAPPAARRVRTAPLRGEDARRTPS